MKILYLTDQLRLHGGVEKILSEKINYLIDVLGHEVVLATTEQQGKPPVYPLSEQAVHHDFGINYDRGNSYFSSANVFKTVKHFIKLRNFITNLTPDIIISVGFTPEQYFLPYISRRIPIVKEIHFSGHILQKQTGWKSSKSLMDYFFKKYHRVVVLNKDEEKYYPIFKTVAIPNFVDVLPGSFPRDNTVIAAGRIAPVKQFDHLIEAWSLIADNHQDWKVKIFGEGDRGLAEELKNLINTLNVEHCIEFKGATGFLSKEMANAKIYAMTSSTECFPMVLLEAQAQGLAVVSYDCPNGPRNILENGLNGILTEDQNIPKLAAAISRMITDTEAWEAVSRNAVQNAERFTAKNIMKQWDALFTNLVYEAKN